nr:MAG TPA: tail assembly protein [Bacteriophage sp.]
MSNSPLVNYTRISPNKNSPRNHKIDTITIHCVVGQCSVETLGNIFAPTSKQASSNYGIGYDGKIGMYVEEKDRSWCSSNAANDNRAVTIEVASDTTHPYAVNDKAFAALLDLVTDICKRNGIDRLVWSTNKTDRVNHKNGCNMTVHRDYANKSCPGDYLYNRHGEIAAEVNRRLGASVGQDSEVVYTVQKGDTLSGIATKYGTTYQKIAAYNGIANPNLIHPGQKIKIPAADGATTTPQVKTYTVKKGDSLWSIAAATLGNGARWPEIQKANSLSGTVIHPGQVLKIPV